MGISNVAPEQATVEITLTITAGKDGKVLFNYDGLRHEEYVTDGKPSVNEVPLSPTDVVYHLSEFMKTLAITGAQAHTGPPPKKRRGN